MRHECRHLDELSAMAFEQRSSKPRLQSMYSGQISSVLDLTYAPSTITTQQPTEPTTRTAPAAQAPQVLQTLTVSRTTANTTPTQTNSSTHATNILNTSQKMETCDPIGTPMEIKDKLDLDKNGTLVNATKYRGMISSLMYLTSSRLDIVHATCLCTRYQAQPTEKHLKEVKRIFHYIWGTVNMGIWYTKDSGFEFTRFLDADYAGCRDSFKSTSGGT
ncbi:hypothetical protein Tco_1430936 [Tanacetum coccineum]